MTDKAMTIEERATELFYRIREFKPTTELDRREVSEIIFQITQAVEEAKTASFIHGGIDVGLRVKDIEYAKGFSEAREMAAKICEDAAFKASCEAAEQSNDFMFAANKQGAKRLEKLASTIRAMQQPGVKG